MQNLLVLLCDSLFKDSFHLLKLLFYQMLHVLAVLQVLPKRLNRFLVCVPCLS